MPNLSLAEFALRDSLAAGCWFSSTLLASWVIWKWVSGLFAADFLFAKICHALVMFWAGVVVTAVSLGLCGWLNGPLLLALFAGLALVGLGAWRRSRLPASPQTVEAGGRENLWLFVWAVPVSWWAAHVVVNGLLRFPSDWDSLEYHIPMIDHWLQAGSLYVPAGSRRCFNPGNNEILGLWLVAPFSGDFFIHLGNFLPVILLACASVELAKEIGLSRLWGHLFGLMNVSHFVVFRQLVNSQNDVGAAACFFASILYAFRHQRGGRRADLFLGAMSLGLLAGTKYYGPGYAALVIATWMLLACFTRRSSVPNIALASGLGLVALGGYWYLRNTIVTGSPFFPREFSKHPDLLTQICPNLAHTSFLGNRSPQLLPLYLKAVARMIGPCQLVAFILVPVSCCWLLGSGLYQCFWQKRIAQGKICLALWLLLAGTAVLLSVTPMAVENNQPGSLNQLRMQYCPMRYSLCFLNTAGLAAFVLLRDLFRWVEKARERLIGSRTRRRMDRFAGSVVPITAVGLMLAVAVQFYSAAVWLRTSQKGGGAITALQLNTTAEIAVTILTWGATVLLVARTWPSLLPWIKRGSILSAFCAYVWASAVLSERWHVDFVAHYDHAMGSGLAVLSEQVPGTRICALTPGYYPFFGSYRQFHACKPYFVYSADWLMRYLAEERISYVAANFRIPPSARGEAAPMNKCFQQCCENHPDIFEVKRGKNDRVLFAVRQPQFLMHRATPAGRNGLVEKELSRPNN